MTRAPKVRSFRARAAEKSAAGAQSASRWPLEWMYFAATMVAWSFTPLLRRLIDFHNGAFNPVTPISLIPFVMVLPLAFVCLRKDRLARMSGLFKLLACVWVATFAYGFLIAAAVGSVGAGVYELVQYLVPAIAGAWLAGQDLPAAQLLRRLAIVVLPCAALVALYGIAQWVNPPAWDVMWVDGSGFQSADNPVPFGMRVFSTLNSPEPAADFFVLTVMLLLPWLRLRNVWTWPLMAGLGAALMLTLVREAWVGLIVGAIVYLALSPRRLNALPSLALLVTLLVVLVSSLPVLLGSERSADVITTRLSTLGDVGHDDSALARQQEISTAIAQGLGNPIGGGLGNIGAAARLGSNAQTDLGNNLDSGYLSRFIELGWLGMTGYLFVVLGGPAVIAYRLLNKTASVAGASAVAMCAALAWSDAANDAHFGLNGMFFWLALAVGSLAAGARKPAGEGRPARPVWKGLQSKA